MKTFISKVSPLNQHAVVIYANAVHNQGTIKNVNIDEACASLSASTGNNFVVARNSVTLLDDGRSNSLIRAIMVPAVDVVPMENSAHMQALSANMFMDDKDNMWAARDNGSGQVLVRALSIDNPEELVDMMTSCSNTASVSTAQALNPQHSRAIVAFEQSLLDAQGADFVTYFSSKSGAITAGFVAAEVDDAGHVELLVVSSESNAQEEQIPREALVGFVRSDDIEYPDQVTVSSISGVDANALIEYYRKVYGYNTAYFEQLKSNILRHSF